MSLWLLVTGRGAAQQGFMVSGLHASFLTERRPAGAVFFRSPLLLAATGVILGTEPYNEHYCLLSLARY